MIEYPLSAFASLFEVAIGINLVFSVWDTLRNQAVARFDVISKEMEQAISAVLGENYEGSRTATDFAVKQTRYINRLKGLSSFGKYSGLILTACLLALLAHLGFNPDFSLQDKYIYIILFFSVAFSPLFLLFGNLYTARCKNRLEEFKEQHSNIFLDLQDCTSN
ncbi:hypothetical protein AB4622_22625 [Vibrio splendidus]|uniref:hypothetical protein n=1 Tax=Vibrio splendidus TaxID=29497 RepID=UPI00352F304F